MSSNPENVVDRAGEWSIFEGDATLDDAGGTGEVALDDAGTGDVSLDVGGTGEVALDDGADMIGSCMMSSDGSSGSSGSSSACCVAGGR